jgi:hypothetical protein
VLEPHVESGRLALELGVAGDDQGDVGEELSAPPAPEQCGEAVVIARDEERHALASGGERESPAHRERLRDLSGERLLERPLVGVADVQPEFDPHDEEAATWGSVVC